MAAAQREAAASSRGSALLTRFEDRLAKVALWADVHSRSIIDVGPAASALVEDANPAFRAAKLGAADMESHARRYACRAERPG